MIYALILFDIRPPFLLPLTIPMVQVRHTPPPRMDAFAVQLAVRRVGKMLQRHAAQLTRAT